MVAWKEWGATQKAVELVKYSEVGKDSQVQPACLSPDMQIQMLQIHLAQADCLHLSTSSVWKAWRCLPLKATSVNTSQAHTEQRE